MRLLEPHGRRRDYEDMRPTRFVPGPEGEGQYPEYPWVMKGPEPKDFVGNEFSKKKSTAHSNDWPGGQCFKTRGQSDPLRMGQQTQR